MRKTILKIVRETIKSEFNRTNELNIEEVLEKYPELKEFGACFVTLTLKGNLRGCIGSLEAHQPLYKDIIANAKFSAFSDSGFVPLQENEVDKIKIEVSILSEPTIVTYYDKEDLKNQIEPFVDGIIIKHENRSATYLPSVWEQLPEFEDFFESLLEKGGMDRDCLSRHPKVYKYQVKKYEEKVRQATFETLFYPSEKEEIEEYFRKVKVLEESIRPRALIVPHAGYMYSGDVANVAYNYIKDKDYKRVVVIGPSHKYMYTHVSGSFFDVYDTPCGEIEIDNKYLKMLKDKFGLIFNKDYHLREHSTEVQAPFIKHYANKNAKIIELIYSNESNLAEIIDFLLRDDDNLVVVSTDLSHFLTLQGANAIDMNCVEGVANLDCDKLRECDACGIWGLKGVINSAKAQNLQTKVLKYKTSFEETGDESSVVGYMSAIVY